MLGLKGFSNCHSKISTLNFFDKSLYLLNLRLHVRTFIPNTNSLECNEDGKIILKLDPVISSVADKLIYSDYIEGKKLKFGYRKNKEIENTLRSQAASERIRKHISDPVYSSALKYLTKESNIPQSKNEKTSKNPEKDKKLPRQSVHMPYASTDVFQTTKKDIDNSEIKSLDDKTPYSNLNQDYKRLYDAYIAAKKSSSLSDNSKVIDTKIEDLESQILKLEMKRPDDDLSNVPTNWMADYEQFDEKYDDKLWQSNYGTPNVNIPVSKIPCGGCGAHLHCQDSALPGYLPSELFTNTTNDELKSLICQRCHFIKHYNATLEVKVSPDIYPEILSNIEMKKKKVAVILMIDVTDFPCSIWPNLHTIIGKTTNVFIVGNKIDLLPRDGPRFIENVQDSLMKAVENAGIKKFNIKHVTLVSAKTGYGIERLINKLHNIWEYKGDVYMIGCTNVGKSSLFNALLQSDYCKIQAVDLIQRATTSPWPGTTLNLLKFPILNPAGWRLKMRVLRLTAENQDRHAEIEFNRRQVTATRDINFATLQERIEQTFSPTSTLRGPALMAHERRMASGHKFGIDENDPAFKNGKWCYDTPGVVHPDQIIHLLTTEELLLTLPRKIISPRSFIFKPGQTLFIAGLGRLDFLSGPEFIRITVFRSHLLPITICSSSEADTIYEKLLQTEALAVPINNPERLKIWPSLESKDFTTTGISNNKSSSDILLSNAGWIAVTPKEGEEVTFRAWTPEGRGLYQRTPAMLANSIALRGPRIRESVAYRCGRQVYNKP